MGVVYIIVREMRLKLTIFFLFSSFQLTYSTSTIKNMREASWSKAVSNYFSSQSLSSMVLGQMFPSLVPKRLVDERVDLELDGEADWLVAISKTLARQSTYNNVISEMLKGITRIVGWLLLTLTLYGNVFTDLI